MIDPGNVNVTEITLQDEGVFLQWQDMVAPEGYLQGAARFGTKAEPYGGITHTAFISYDGLDLHPEVKAAFAELVQDANLLAALWDRVTRGLPLS